MTQVIFNFNDKKVKKLKNKKNLLGGKGTNLGEMGSLGLPVPPGFTISTAVCDIFYKNEKKLTKKIIRDVNKELKNIEKKNKKKIWRSYKSSFSFSQVWSKNIYARNDGHYFKFRFK